ncbi:MATE family efflux transporter [Clostridiaceae bacterium M8S5]|nr:MATE family efflux transporter [Clostridiaceae bacterium M8S5]
MVYINRLDKNFYNRMAKLAIPIALQSLIFSLLNMVDILMIGKLGETNIAAVSVANQISFIFMLIMFGINSGSSIFTAQFWGKRDIINIRKILGISLILGVGVGILFAIGGVFFPKQLLRLFTPDDKIINIGERYLVIVVLSYGVSAVSFAFTSASRSINQTKLPMVTSSISLACNTLLNYVLIFGHLGFDALGVRGAAYATLISRLIEMALIITIIYMNDGVLAAKIKEMFNLSKEFIKTYFKTSGSVILNELFWVLGVSVYTAIYGRMGEQALTAVQISNNVRNIFMVLNTGLSSACAIMIGNKIGEKQYEQANEYANKFTRASLALSVVLGLGIVIIAKPALLLFDISDEVKMLTFRTLIAQAIFLPATLYSALLIVGIFRSGGDTKFSLYLEMLGVWFIGVPLAAIGALVLKLPIYLVVALVKIEEVVKIMVGLVRVKSKKWIKNVVDDVK